MRHTAVFLVLAWVSGVCVSSDQPEVKELKCIVGEIVTFQMQVNEHGYLQKNVNKVIAKVFDRVLHITIETFKNRVQWDSSTGFFSITGLKMEDSQKYAVFNTETPPKVNQFQLTVYNPVSTPQVSSRNKTKPTCRVLCSVENGREVTLSWQRDGKTLSHTSSPDLHTHLSLPLEIEYNSAPYSCVVKNPARKETVTVKPEEFCFGPVPKPHVRYKAVQEHQDRICSLLCSVENGREVTLSWQVEGDTLSHTRSPDLSTTLSLPLEIRESNITYYCVAKNPGGEERTVFHPTALCREEEGNSACDVVVYIMFVLRLVEFVLVTLAVALLLHLYREGRVLTKHSTEKRRRRYQETDTAL